MPIIPVMLTDDEKEILSRIEFEPLEMSGGPDAVIAVCQAAKELTESLLERNAIPLHRLRFFTDKDYNIGGHGSMKVR